MEELEENLNLLDVNIDKLNEYGFPKCSKEEYINLLLRLYINELDNHKANMLFRSICCVYGNLFEGLDLFNKPNYGAIMGEVFDLLLEPYLLDVWRKNKQVYKPDSDFCNALLKTENLTLTKDMLMHIPCNHFYIDLSECNLFLPISGIFVNVFFFDNSDKVNISFFLLSNELTTWSSYDVLNFDEEKEIQISQKQLEALSPDISVNYKSTDIVNIQSFDDLVCVNICENDDKSILGNLNRYEASFFVYQLLAYMVSHEPQIEDSPITKSTYKPPKNEVAIKNKFSEIQIKDVGIRFGKSFRQQQKKYQCTTILTKHLENKRKSPIPHFRSAHWQGYWVGKGRAEHIVKWIEPTFIGGGESNDVVIHKI